MRQLRDVSGPYNHLRFQLHLKLSKALEAGNFLGATMEPAV